MRTFVKIGVVLLLLGAAGAAAYGPTMKYWRERRRPEWRFEEAARGDIVWVVNATGEVKPVLLVQVGTFVSGPIQELLVDFNQEVKEGDLLARIDPRIYEASVKRDEATLRSRQGDVQRVEALLRQARNDENRATMLRERDEHFVSTAEMDQLVSNRMSLEAQLEIARAAVDQAKANLENSEANFQYTFIRSPVDGVIVDRKIDPGQTLAAQFQTPVLFTVAPDMRKKMHVHALVDEADVGVIREAKRKGQPVTFTVDAYPDDLFEGKIEEIRYVSTSTQNVVTYPVIVAAANPDLKLLPGMTATISFQVDEHKDVLKIPNAALRFYPRPEYVRLEDRKLLEGVDSPDDEQQESDFVLSAQERAEIRRARHRRHVWVLEGELLRAIEVVTGLTDNRYTELVSGDLREGAKLVTGLQPKKLF